MFWRVVAFRGAQPGTNKMEPTDMATTQRIAAVLWALAQGQELTNADAAEMTGVTPEGARMMLGRISEIWPIYNFRRDGRDVWTVLRAE